MVVGGGVSGGVKGAWPGLTDTDSGDVRVVNDYRAVLSEVLSTRMRATDLGTVFPGFDTLLGGLAGRHHAVARAGPPGSAFGPGRGPVVPSERSVRRGPHDRSECGVVPDVEPTERQSPDAISGPRAALRHRRWCSPWGCSPASSTGCG